MLAPSTRPSKRFAPWQAAAIANPYDHFAFYGGVATGKSYTGSHFAIEMIERHPDKTGFIGANTYDQLTQASLREMFYWLDHYGFEWVIDCQPPPHWNARRAFKKYSNILSVRVGLQVVHVFTRVLSDPDALRGVEFSWYWLDETRDTPQNTHDVVLSRMRERTDTADIRKGIITTTTNGEDWSHARFVKGNDGSRMYGSMHVSTRKSLEYGIITQSYFDTMLKSYSPLMAMQELDALHVNVLGGRAYYAASYANQARVAPWGDSAPNPERPLVIGCDFNFNPAPCVWMVGQAGPNLYGPGGLLWSDCIHWFGEIAMTEASSRMMALALLARYPGFFYEIYGDVSGNVGTTSNAGETDYQQMSDELAQAGAMFSLFVDQDDPKHVRTNPRVRNRVENMNAMFKNALGQVRQTYNPDACPLFDGDLRTVGWKQTTLSGRGKLDNAGDVLRTHATDGAGYALWRKFPPGRVLSMVSGVRSPTLAETAAVLGHHR